MNEVKTKTVKRKTGAAATVKVRRITQIAMLGALATVLMLFEFPLPFIAPPFYEMDFSEVPVLIGAFAMGPLAGVGIELIKVLMNLVLNGTITGGVGELANFVIGASFVVPAGLIYKRHKTRKNAVVGMAVGTVSMMIVGCIMNATVLLPAYSLIMPIDTILSMGKAIHASIDSVWKFVVLLVAPFNLVKGILVSLITLLLYKNISIFLKETLK